MMRLRSSEPEPTPSRPPGYYWIKRQDGDEPEIAEYAPSYCTDQDDRAQIIVCSYGWMFIGDDDGWIQDDSLAQDQPLPNVISQQPLRVG